MIDRKAPLSTGWQGVYAALDCPCPGTEDDRRTPNSTAIDLHSLRKRDKQSSGITTDGRTDWTPAPSAPGGINVALNSSSAAARSESGSRAPREVTMQDSDTVAPKNSSHYRDSEQHAEREQTNELAADGGEDALDLGTRVVDRDDIAGERNRAVVTALPDEPAYAYTIDELDGEPSVADLNPAYGASGMVATVAFLDDLNKHVPDWRDRDVEELAGVVETTEALTGYTYPVERLRHAPPGDNAQGGDER